MKIINATAWSTDALKSVVDRACLEIKELEDCRHPAYAEICFKPTSSYHKPVHTTESRITRQRLDVLLWQPVKFKNKLDELTLIAAVTGDDGFVMPPLAAAQLLVHIKDALGGRYGYGKELDEVAKSVKNPPVVHERLAEQGRIDEAEMVLAQAKLDLATVREKFEAAEAGFLRRIDKFQKTIDFNKKKLDRVKKEQLTSR
jgi:hypothetical protein